LKGATNPFLYVWSPPPATTEVALEQLSEESKPEKPTAQCMAAIVSRSEILNEKLSVKDGFEIAESFGIKTKKITKYEDYEFPMKIPYIAKLKDKDKSLIK
jgi:hypothetical protein